MNKMAGLVKRNLLVYFKDTSSVIFSMLTPIIILVLYLLFIRSNLTSAIESAAVSIKDLLRPGDIDAFTSGLQLCGILGTAMITVPYNTISMLARDRENKIDYDVFATPIKRYQIVISYYISSVISAFVMTSAVMAVGMLLISVNNDLHFSCGAILRLLGIVFLGSMSGAAVFMPLVMIFKNTSALSAFMGIISAASGFVIGAYVPLSQFSDGIQTLCNVFPATGITVLLKHTVLSGLLESMDASIGGIDNGMFTGVLKETFSMFGTMNGHELSYRFTLIYVIAVTLVFIAAVALIFPKVYKRK